MIKLSTERIQGVDLIHEVSSLLRPSTELSSISHKVVANLLMSNTTGYARPMGKQGCIFVV